MKQVFCGNIENLTSLIDRIDGEQKPLIFPTNKITHAELNNDKLEFSGIFCKGIGLIDEQKDLITIDLKVRLKRQFILVGIFIVLFFSGFIWGENVTINGDSNPSIWKRIGFFTIGLAFLSVPFFILRKLRNEFEGKIIELIK